MQRHIQNHLDSQLEINKGYQPINQDTFARLRGGLIDKKTKQLENELKLDRHDIEFQNYMRKHEQQLMRSQAGRKTCACCS